MCVTKGDVDGPVGAIASRVVVGRRGRLVTGDGGGLVAYEDAAHEHLERQFLEDFVVMGAVNPGVMHGDVSPGVCVYALAVVAVIARAFRLCV